MMIAFENGKGQSRMWPSEIVAPHLRRWPSRHRQSFKSNMAWLRRKWGFFSSMNGSWLSPLAVSLHCFFRCLITLANVLAHLALESPSFVLFQLTQMIPELQWLDAGSCDWLFSALPQLYWYESCLDNLWIKSRIKWKGRTSDLLITD